MARLSQRAGWIAAMGAALVVSMRDQGTHAFGEAPTRAQAIAEAGPLVEAARTAKPGDDAAVVKAAKKAVELLRPFRSASSDDAAFALVWNDALAAAEYQGLKLADECVLKAEVMPSYPISFGLPVGHGWVFTPLRPGEDDQLWGEITKTVPTDRVLRRVKIWVYRWDATYSGTGGENSKGLAEGDLANDRYKMVKVKSRSDRVTAVALSKSFPRAYFYEVVGDDLQLGDARRRNYYVKGTMCTYNFEAIEIRRTDPKDDPYSAWLASGEQHELDSVLKSIEAVAAEKKKK